jgi:hypothetical protein
MKKNLSIAEIEKIRDWMRNAWVSRSFLRYDDLHIDEISDAYKTKRSWISGGLACLSGAQTVRADLRIPAYLGLAFELKQKKTVTTLNLRSRTDLYRELTNSPPSIYLRTPELGLEPEPCVSCDFGAVGVCDVHAKCYYTQFKQSPNPDYYRAVWILIPPVASDPEKGTP